MLVKAIARGVKAMSKFLTSNIIIGVCCIFIACSCGRAKSMAVQYDYNQNYQNYLSEIFRIGTLNTGADSMFTNDVLYIIVLPIISWDKPVVLKIARQSPPSFHDTWNSCYVSVSKINKRNETGVAKIDVTRWTVSVDVFNQVKKNNGRRCFKL